MIHNAIIAAGQALVIEGRWPECVYANLCFWNRFQQAIDYRYRPGSLNRKQMQLNKDGSFTCVLAHVDPGVPNWIETAGHSLGTMCWRWIGADRHPLVQTRVMKLADLA